MGENPSGRVERLPERLEKEGYFALAFQGWITFQIPVSSYSIFPATPQTVYMSGLERFWRHDLLKMIQKGRGKE